VLKSSVDEGLFSISHSHSRLDLPKTFAHKQDTIDEHPVGRALDLEIPKKDIGAKKGKDLIDAVI